VTRDTLTSRGGLTFLVKYVEAIGILTLLLNRFAKIKKSVKVVSVGNLFLQALYFFFDGTRRHLCHFDELQRDQGYRAVVEMPEEQMASSHAIKRFFRAFNIFHATAFRWVLKELLVWRLQLQKPRVVVMTLDTSVGLWKSFRDQTDHESGIGQLVIGFPPESAIAFNPER
jgi:hypothetical protein